jgi:hypothetical protein
MLSNYALDLHVIIFLFVAFFINLNNFFSLIALFFNIYKEKKKKKGGENMRN